MHEVRVDGWSLNITTSSSVAGDIVKFYDPDSSRDGDSVDIDIEGGRITVGEKEFNFPGLPPQILEIRDAGGLLEYSKKKLEAAGPWPVPAPS